MLWGTQASFLIPVVALLLVALYDATPAQVGLILALYNAGGFVTSMVLPTWADRHRTYLTAMLIGGAATLATAVGLWMAPSVWWAAAVLIVFGGLAGGGLSLLFAHMRATGSRSSEIVSTRAVTSFAWVAGPPLAAFIMAGLGTRSILVAIGLVAVGNVATTLWWRHREGPVPSVDASAPGPGAAGLSRLLIGVVVLGILLLQATNVAGVSAIPLLVTETLKLNIAWSGIVLGVAAALEIPALLVVARVGERVGHVPMLTVGCLAAIAYYVGMAVATHPLVVIALQALNAVFFAVVAGTALAWFQDVISRPGLAAGLYSNTRRLGAIVAGPVLGVGATLPLAVGYHGVFALCAALSLVALAVIVAVGLATRRPATEPSH